MNRAEIRPSSHGHCLSLRPAEVVGEGGKTAAQPMHADFRKTGRNACTVHVLPESIRCAFDERLDISFVIAISEQLEKPRYHDVNVAL